MALVPRGYTECRFKWSFQEKGFKKKGLCVWGGGGVGVGWEVT